MTRQPCKSRPRRQRVHGPLAAYPANCTEFPVEATIAQWQEKITVLRNLRAERNVPPAAKIRPILVAQGEVADLLRRGMAHIRSLAGAETVQIVESAERPADSAVAVLADAEVILPLEGLIDKEAERAKLRKSLADLDRQIAPLRAKLGNEAFVCRAPAEVVAAQRAKLAELRGPAGRGRRPDRRGLPGLSLVRCVDGAAQPLYDREDTIRRRPPGAVILGAVARAAGTGGRPSAEPG